MQSEIYLQGSVEVARAATTMQRAATDISQAAQQFNETAQRLELFLGEWLIRLELALDRNDR